MKLEQVKNLKEKLLKLFPALLGTKIGIKGEEPPTGYVIYKLQNAPDSAKNPPDIIITEDDPEWDQAFKSWLAGKNPTNSPLWKKGVFAETRKKT